MLMDVEQSVLVVIDVQERLCPVMDDPRKVIDGCARLMRGAAKLGVPVLVTEQYPKGIGHTVPDLRGLAPPDSFIEKITFPATGAPAFMERLGALGRRQAVLAGIESHVCVLQTLGGLRAKGYETFLVTDACSSRRSESERLAQARAQGLGAALVNVEMVLFEWLGRAGTEAFRDVLPLIK